MAIWRTVLAGVAALVLAGRAEAKCQLQQLAELPVTMRDMDPIVPARINGQDVDFIADSGAFFSTLSPASAAALNLHLAPGPFGVYVEGIGGDAAISVATVKTFGIGKSDIPHVDFVVAGADVGGGYAVGLMGENVLGLADAEYDLSNGVIRLMRAQGCGGSALAYWASGMAWNAISIEAHDPPRNVEIIGSARVNGRSMRVEFDTGANLSSLSIAAARRAGIRTDGPGVRFAGYSRGIGRKLMKTWIAPVDSFQLGDEQVNHTELRIGDVGSDDTDMLIGADFFLSHHVYVANSQRKLYFTYNGGPVFDLKTRSLDDAAPAPQTIAATAATTATSGAGAPADPTDADGFSRRGEARASRGDNPLALSDLDRAVSLAPKEPRYLYERARIHAALKQPYLAMADLDAALALRPDDAEMRLMRAELRYHGRDRDGARADLDAAATAAPKPSDLRLAMGELYLQMDEFAAAIQQFDLWIHDHEDDSRFANALNGRCWARALGDRELDAALADCDRAVRISHGVPAILDTRGLVHLRRGELDKAKADYDAALNGNPKIAWALYGRGLIEERSGEADKGAADIAQAKALAPQVVRRAVKLGLTETGAAPAPAASR